MDDQQLSKTKTETWETRHITQDGVSKVVRSPTERAKSVTPKKTLTLNTTADASTTGATSAALSYAPSNTIIHRLSLSPRSPSSMRRYFQKDLEDSRRTAKSTTSQLFRNFRAAVLTGGQSRLSFRYGRKGNRLPGDTDGAEESSDEAEDDILSEPLNGNERKISTEPSFVVSTEAEGKKQMSEKEINDLVRNTIRRVRQNAKLKSQKAATSQESADPSSNLPMVESLLHNDVTFSPDKTAQRKFSWSSVEKSDDDDFDETDGVDGMTRTAAALADSRDDTAKRDATEICDSMRESDTEILDSIRESDTVYLLPYTTLQPDQSINATHSSTCQTEAINNAKTTTGELSQSKTDKNVVLGSIFDSDKVIEPPQTMTEEVATIQPPTPSSHSTSDNAGTSAFTPGEPSLSTLLSNGGESILSGKDICFFVQNSIDRARLTRLEITELLGTTPPTWQPANEPQTDAPCPSDDPSASDGIDPFNGCASPLSSGPTYRGFFFSECGADKSNGQTTLQLLAPESFAPMIKTPATAPSTTSSDRYGKHTAMKKIIGDCRNEPMSEEGFVLDPLNLLTQNETDARGNTLLFGAACCSPFECSSRLTASPVGKPLHFFHTVENQGDSPFSIKSRVTLTKKDGDDASGIEIIFVSTTSSLESENSLLVGNTSEAEKEPLAGLKSQVSNTAVSEDMNKQLELSLRNDTVNDTEDHPRKAQEFDDSDFVASNVLQSPAVFTRVTTMTEILDQTSACTTTEVELIEDAETRNPRKVISSESHDDFPTTTEACIHSGTINDLSGTEIVENAASEVTSDEIKVLVKSAHHAARRPLPLLQDTLSSDEDDAAVSISPSTKAVENTIATRECMHRLRRSYYNKRASLQARREKSNSIQRKGSDSALITEEFLAEISSKKGSKISANELAQLLSISTSKRSGTQFDSTSTSSAVDRSLGYERRRRSRSRSRHRNCSRSRSQSSVEWGTHVAPTLQSQFCMDLLDLFKPADILDEDERTNADENANDVTWIDSGADNYASLTGGDSTETEDNRTRNKASKWPSEVTDTVDEQERRRLTLSFSDGRVTDRYDDLTSSDDSSTFQ